MCRRLSISQKKIKISVWPPIPTLYFFLKKEETFADQLGGHKQTRRELLAEVTRGKSTGFISTLVAPPIQEGARQFKH